jgi:putative endonuclease
MACVYVLKSLKDGRLYTGSTRETAQNRLAIHNRGSVRSTKARRPFKLVYTAEFATYTEAKKKELLFKTTRGRKELMRLLSSIQR